MVVLQPYSVLIPKLWHLIVVFLPIPHKFFSESYNADKRLEDLENDIRLLKNFHHQRQRINPVGPRGLTGPRGPRGYTGPRGQRGYRGPTGPRGLTVTG